jgi:hypothetical protein
MNAKHLENAPAFSKFVAAYSKLEPELGPYFSPRLVIRAGYLS